MAKKNYEIALMQHVTGSVEDDYETVHYNSYLNTYWEYRRKAIEYSKHIGEEVVDGYHFHGNKGGGVVNAQRLDAGLAAVKIVCYTETDETSYEPLFYEYYKNGKMVERLTF